MYAGKMPNLLKLMVRNMFKRKAKLKMTTKTIIWLFVNNYIKYFPDKIFNNIVLEIMY